VSLLLDIGWFPDIALLTTGHRHYVQVRETERSRHRGYWRSYWDEDEVFYGHVLEKHRVDAGSRDGSTGRPTRDTVHGLRSCWP